MPELLSIKAPGHCVKALAKQIAVQIQRLFTQAPVAAQPADF
jgi:hypothetical protein